MIYGSKKQKTKAAKTRLLTSAIVGASLLALYPSATATHVPLVKKEAPSIATSKLLGDNDLSAMAAHIEAKFVKDSVEEKLDRGLSESAAEAARLAYAQSVFKPLWTQASAETLLSAPEFFASHGMETPKVFINAPALVKNRFETPDAEIRANADIQLTFLWLQMTSVLSVGLSDEGEAIKPRSNAPARSELVARIVNAASGDPLSEMNAFAPQAPQYKNLRLSLDHYENLINNGGWKAVPSTRDIIEVGETHDIIPAIRQRLIDENYIDALIVPETLSHPLLLDVSIPTENILPLDDQTDPLLFDSELEAGLKRFQARHGLTQDGKIGPATLRAMNESPASKVERIKATLSDWRNHKAFNQSASGQYIWANIPSYSVEGWSNGIKEISMKTIVGKKRTPTTDFSDEVEYIVVNPKWFLPIGLFKRQKLRKLRKDPGYAARHHYKIYDRSTGTELDSFAIDWKEKGISRKIQMVQQPGAHNALGELKIIFPNRHSIYLHSTPDKHLFERDIRALSSGCIRLHDPVAMANWITDKDSNIDTEQFNRILNAEERKRFYLETHMPVHITYMQVTADESGQASFHRDIYKKHEAPEKVNELYNLDTPQNYIVSLKGT
jgi:murein L,D-transpeptidase YcbB/YkuD